MKRFLLVLGAAGVLLVLAAILAPLLLPLDTYRAQIVGRVSDATGLVLRIDGAMRLSFFPRLTLEFADVGLSQAGAGESSDELVTLDELRVALKWRPLLSGQVAVASLVLDTPVLRLEADEKGTWNWATVKPATPDRGAAKDSAAETPGLAAALDRLTLDDVRIVNGSLSWSDRRSGAAGSAGEIDLRIGLPGLDQPFEAEGELSWKGEKVAVEIDLARPRALFERGTTPVTAQVETGALRLSYTGEVDSAAPVVLDGSIDLASPSVRRLAAWLGSPVEAPDGTFGALRIQGKISVADSKIRLRDAGIAIDDLAGKGNVEVRSGGARTRVDGSLAVDRLDLDPYLPPVGTPPAAGANKADEGWSTTAMDLDGLRAVDANLHLSVGSLQVRGLQLGKGVLDARLEKGILSLDLAELALYQGKGRGKVVLDASGPASVGVDLRATMEGIQVEPLLRDAAGIDRLAGTGLVELDVRARGSSQDGLVRSLQGKGRVDLRDGAIRGINLVAMVLHVASAFTAGDPSARTEFSVLGASFTIGRGVLRNDDLVLKSPLLEATGAGTVDLGNRTTDYKVTPRVLTPLVGQLGFGTPSVMVPVLIRGSWNRLRYEPDLVGMMKLGLEVPGSILRGVTKIPGAVLGEPKGQDAQDRAPESGRKNPADLLKGLFGR